MRTGLVSNVAVSGGNVPVRSENSLYGRAIAVSFQIPLIMSDA